MTPEHDDTSVNGAIDGPSDIEDDAGMCSFEDGDQYDLESGDEGDDEEE